jgi:hypothetical protein
MFDVCVVDKALHRTCSSLRPAAVFAAIEEDLRARMAVPVDSR